MRNAFTGWTVPFALLLLAGCSTGKPTEIQGDEGGVHLAKVGIAYARAAEQLGRPPLNVEELRPVLVREFGDADGLLRSSDDGQPFEILWGADIFQAPKGVADPVVIAYERQGVNGRRYVLTVGVAVQPMTEDEFARAHFPKGHKPPRKR